MEHTYPDLILRVTPPRSHKMILQRGRLSTSSPEIRDRSLIILQAPSGYGKTSLLVQWRKDWISNGEVVAWLTLDENEDRGRFIHSLVVAMDVAIGKTRVELSNYQYLSDSKHDFDVLRNCLADIADMGRDTVLMIDDFHYFSERIEQTVIKYLIHNAPANLRIVISSREVVEIDIGSLISFGQCCVLETQALQFLREETLTLLAIWSNAKMEVADAEYLHELTCGWPLGLQLVISSIGKNANLKDAVSRVSAIGGSIERYFVDFLIDRLPVEVSAFLIKISVLDAVCPSLCAAITSSEHAETYLQSLRKTTPIFIELKEPWLRMHPLLKKFLHGRWLSLALEQRSEIHENATHWLATHAMYEEAAYHAMQANQNERAYEFVEQCLYEIAVQGQFCRVIVWLDRLPPKEILQRPRLRLAAAWSLAMGKRNGEVAALMTRILADPNLTQNERCECDAIHAFAAYHADRIDDFHAYIAPWFNVVSQTRIKINAIILGQKSLLALYQGTPELARYLLSTAGAGNEANPFNAFKGFSVWVKGMSYLWEGQVKIAEKFLRENLTIAEHVIGRNSGIAISLASALSAALLELDQIEDANAILSFPLELVEQICAPEVIAQAYVTKVRLLVHAGEEAQAHDHLRELCVVGEIRSCPRLVIVGLAERIRLHALKFEIFTCIALKQKLDSLASTLVQVKTGIFAPLLTLNILLSHAYVALAQRDWRQMIEILDRAPPLLDQLHRGRERLQIMLLHALATLQIGGDCEASLNEAFSLSSMYGLRQLTNEFIPLLGAWGRRQLNSESTLQSARAEEKKEAGSGLLGYDSAEGHKFQARNQKVLTPKEHQILFLLTRHMTNKEIGNAMNIGEETVKWHLKNMYGKLHAGTRKHVVARAKIMGILE